MDSLTPVGHFPPLPTMSRLLLALAVGLFVGLEREHRGKEAGLRTFGFAALLGSLGGLLGESYALMSLAFLGVLIIFLNLQALRAEQSAELTTSIALLVTGVGGVFCGLGHTFTPVAVAVMTAALLAWKEPLAGFSLGLTEAELRSAILLAILAFVVYPVLPSAAVDPWDLIAPQSAWATVILIAGVGFASYVLLKIYGARGLEVTGFFGGLVNSSVTVADLAHRAHETNGQLAEAAYRGMLFATAAMVVRNALLLGLLATAALAHAILPLGGMLLATIGLALAGRRRYATAAQAPLQLDSPFSLATTLRYGVLFLALQVAGTLAQRAFGELGFYAVSAFGGLVSSASTVASAAMLATHATISPTTAGIGAVIASLTSVAVTLPLVFRTPREPRLTARVGPAFAIIMAVGVFGAAVQLMVPTLRFDLPRASGSTPEIP
ncbi:MAG: DUF4010 domain-containing protein [Myxococcales bacterium]|jgi:uncharacterized membrane protein (DUF4010 family)|nr:DUF4010 domain-containing protein [Myxococcales bacterium]